MKKKSHNNQNHGIRYAPLKFFSANHLDKNQTSALGACLINLCRIKKFPMKFLSIFIFIGSIVGCNEINDPESITFKPAHGMILVKHGSLEDIQAAIVDYDSIARELQPHSFKVELHPQENGVAVILPDGFPAYDLANMTGWLNAPPSQRNVYDAVSWIVSPGDGTPYYLEPEEENVRGDTLVGASKAGQSIRVYQPECGISNVSHHFSYKEKPEIVLSQNPIKFEMVLDADPSFGNTNFLVNSPDNHTWGW